MDNADQKRAENGEGKVPPVPLAKAADLFPGESADRACEGASFLGKVAEGIGQVPQLISYADEGSRYKANVTYSLMRAWNEAAPDSREKLPLIIKAGIIDGVTYMMDNDPDGLGLYAKAGEPVINNSEGVHSIYQSLHLGNDPQYKRDALVSSADTLDAISKIPNIAEIEKNWPQMDVDSKIEFLQQVHNIHASVRGFDPVHVTTFSQARGQGVGCEGKEDEYSKKYVPMAHTTEENIGFNIWVDPDKPEVGPVGFSNFAEEIDTILHEGTHVHDVFLKKVADDGGIGLSQRNSQQKMTDLQSRPYSNVIAGSVRASGYLDACTVGEAGYLSNPTEEHAYYVGGLVGEYFKKDPSERSNYIPSLRYEAKIMGDQIEANGKLSEALRKKPDSMCPQS